MFEFEFEFEFKFEFELELISKCFRVRKLLLESCFLKVTSRLSNLVPFSVDIISYSS